MRKPSLVLATLALLVLPACFDALNPLEEDAGEAGITIDVVGCDVDRAGVARATAEVTSERAHDTVLLNGELIGEDGVVVQQTSTSLQGVRAGRTYRATLTFGGISRADARADLECDVQLGFATDIPG